MCFDPGQPVQTSRPSVVFQLHGVSLFRNTSTGIYTRLTDYIKHMYTYIFKDVHTHAYAYVFILVYKIVSALARAKGHKELRGHGQGNHASSRTLKHLEQLQSV